MRMLYASAQTELRQKSANALNTFLINADASPEPKSRSLES